MTEPLQPIQTIRYVTYIKEAFVEALRPVFASHSDPLFRDTKVTIETPFDEAHYPAIVIRFYERQIKNAGIGHQEFFPDPEDPSRFIRYKHFFFGGDIEFAIYALSNLERDLLGDSVVQTIAMGDIEAYTNLFLQRIYKPNLTTDPDAANTMININTDLINGFGDTQSPAPWQPEDVLVYQKSYRVAITGEFYSRTLAPTNYGRVAGVDIFPWMPAAGEVQPDPAWAGPDKTYGTADDVPDPAVWEGNPPRDA